MKVKSSITLPSEVLALTDSHAQDRNRSVFVDEAVQAYVSSRARRQRDRMNLDILEATAKRLNREAMDVLYYQAGI